MTFWPRRKIQELIGASAGPASLPARKKAPNRSAGILAGEEDNDPSGSSPERAECIVLNWGIEMKMKIEDEDKE